MREIEVLVLDLLVLKDFLEYEHGIIMVKSRVYYYGKYYVTVWRHELEVEDENGETLLHVIENDGKLRINTIDVSMVGTIVEALHSARHEMLTLLDEVVEIESGVERND